MWLTKVVDVTLTQLVNCGWSGLGSGERRETREKLSLHTCYWCHCNAVSDARRVERVRRCGRRSGPPGFAVDITLE